MDNLQLALLSPIRSNEIHSGNSAWHSHSHSLHTTLHHSDFSSQSWPPFLVWCFPSWFWHTDPCDNFFSILLNIRRTFFCRTCQALIVHARSQARAAFHVPQSLEKRTRTSGSQFNGVLRTISEQVLHTVWEPGSEMVLRTPLNWLPGGWAPARQCPTFQHKTNIPCWRPWWPRSRTLSSEGPTARIHWFLSWRLKQLLQWHFLLPNLNKFTCLIL